MFALAAMLTPLFAVPASVYSTGQIALDPTLFYTLSVTNVTGALLSGIALIGLFTQYPKPLFRPVWILASAAIFGTLIVLCILQTGRSNAVAKGTLAELVTALLIGIVQ